MDVPAEIRGVKKQIKEVIEEIKVQKAKLDALESSGSSSEPSEEAVEQKANEVAEVKAELLLLRQKDLALQGQLTGWVNQLPAGKSCCSISNASLLPK